MSADNWRVCPNCDNKDTLREDYEIGIYEGEFFVGYSCSCGVCGFKWNYNYTKSVEDILEGA
jgi:hypothetical protein